MASTAVAPVACYSARAVEGTSIGPYRIVRKLGEGGMGAVWLGEHTLLGRRAAIKVLLREFSAKQEIVQRFFNEARAVTAIADPGIVQVFDFGYHVDGSAFLVMEVLEGEAMDARLRRIGRFTPVDAVRLMAQIATSLGAAHGKGVVHRDLKPENIFIVGDPAVTGGERSKILDFGIAKLAGDEPGKIKTRTGIVMGTPVYMSPEQCRGMSNIDARSDIYALGCVLFTMLCGRPPFEAEGSGDLIIAHVRDTPPTPSTVAPGIPPELDAVVLRCLAKDPAQRFQSTAELVHALASVEPALYGIDPGHSFPGGYRRAPTPAAALAYRQQPTPPPPAQTGPYPQHPTGPHTGPHTGAHTGPPTGPHLNAASTAQTTLGSASAPVHPTRPPARGRGWIAAVIGLVIVGGVAAIVAGTRGGGGDSTSAAGGGSAVTGASPGSGSATPPPPPNDAGVAATPPPVDAAIAAVPVDAPESVAASVDAGVAPAVDAGTTKTSRTKRTGTSTGTGTKRGSNGTTSSGTVDRGD